VILLLIFNILVLRKLQQRIFNPFYLFLHCLSQKSYFLKTKNTEYETD